MNSLQLDLSRLHGFRLLAGPNGQPVRQTPSADSLPQLLGARLGGKVGITKFSRP